MTLKELRLKRQGWRTRELSPQDWVRRKRRLANQRPPNRPAREQPREDINQPDAHDDDEDHADDAGNRGVEGKLRDGPQNEAHHEEDDQDLNEQSREHEKA